MIIYLKFTAKHVEIKTVNTECEFKRVKNNKITFNCKKCKKEQLKPRNRLIIKFSNTYEFCSGEVNKFILLLRKGVYPFENIDRRGRLNGVSMPEKEAFFSELNLKDISDIGHMHAKKYLKKNLWQISRSIRYL